MSHSRTPQQHRAAVDALIGPRPTVQLPLTAALGRSLTESVMAPGDLPQFDNSQMDGYAVADCHLAGGTFPIGPTVAAGVDPSGPGLYPAGLGADDAEVAPIMTGAKIPDATVAIIPIERCRPDTFRDGGEVTIPATTAGDFIRRQGSDLAAGAELFRAGDIVNPRTVGAAALMGLTTLPVAEPARVVICTGGDEISPAGNLLAGNPPSGNLPAAAATSAAGRTSVATIPDANGPMLQALCAQHLITVAGHVQTRDNPDALKAALEAAVDTYKPTAIITSGGISQGRFEVVRQVLEPAGGWFGHVAQQPGGPQGLSTIAETPVISLPGNPVSTAVSFRLFVAPVLGQAPSPRTVRLLHDIEGLPGRECFVRATTVWKDSTVWAEQVSDKGSHLLAQSTAADCLLAIPAGQNLRAGDKVTSYPI